MINIGSEVVDEDMGGPLIVLSFDEVIPFHASSGQFPGTPCGWANVCGIGSRETEATIPRR